jgi:hypothetical protein
MPAPAGTSASAERTTTPALIAFWLPLALSWTIMIVAAPITSIAISRLPDPEVHLAAYGVTFDIAFLLESPIIMLLSASVALTRDQASYRLLRAVTLWVGGAMTALYTIVVFTPAYDYLVRGLMGVPAAVAAQAQPASQFLLPWVGAIAWRRFHQGPLINNGLTRVVSYGTLVRLGTLATVLAIGIRWPILPGAALGGVALAASVVLESVVNTIWALPVVRRLPARGESLLTVPFVIRFCTPLLVTDVLRTLVRPALTSGVARALLPQISLAAWPVAGGLINLIGGVTMAFQEVTTAIIVDRTSYLNVRRFVMQVAAWITAFAVVVTNTPIIHAYLISVVHLPEALRPHVIHGMQISLLLPALYAIRNLYRGVLIWRRSTVPIQVAMFVSVIVMLLTVPIGLRLRWTGVTLAAVATLAGHAAEVVVLFAFSRSAVRAVMAIAPPATPAPKGALRDAGPTRSSQSPGRRPQE